ncbi:sigma-70 family RNA polymerase sigma factor [Pseudoalteromonas xiamenensis]|uniref:RNA polymerase sigma factor n=1 Tax=Pseudoalteromonas xiamenensis TaxID=882626 RepID=UPI0027E4FCBC|nr:sigma-70 family RNA polymerase sigma factor [Pseudoalteromonas xiamenensis]WMN58348.1 sigma-70 family RNA polymerase sigma factor [Pseudoalteromonas xiamenensis]
MIFSTEAGLIKKAQAGHKQAWLTLVTRYEKQVFNHCLRMVGHREDACDLMQEVFVSVFTALPQFAGDSQFSTWLYKITHARCVDFFRRKKPLEIIDEEQHDLGAEQSLVIDATNREVYSALQQLPIEQRQIVELKFFQHLTFEEIADITDLSTNTIKTRLYSALKKMKNQLEVVHG